MSKVRRLVPKRWTAQEAMNNFKQSVIMLTPEVAERYICDSKDGNRPIITSQVAKLKRRIKRGEWHLGVDALKIDVNGVFFGGHHTCLAVRETGLTIPIALWEGLEPSTRDYDNQGKSNRLGNELARKLRQPHSSKRASYLRVAVDSLSDAKVSLSTVPEYEEWVEQFPAMDAIVEMFAGRKDRNPAPIPGAILFAWRKNPTAVEKFARGFATVEGLTSKDPSHMFDAWWRKWHKGKGGGSAINTVIIYTTLKHVWSQIEGKSPKRAPDDGALITYFREPYQTRVINELLAPWRGPATTGLGELIKSIKFNNAQSKEAV